ncbi:hypothetical protein [Nocardia brasiliensis]|uniref:hypothetical protein n=1 Tax=Nocardia brasiliensis TaxID=37326 RepID=UPI001580F793|nr:hypothetical protein [Nocardia brasiliensis]
MDVNEFSRWTSEFESKAAARRTLGDPDWAAAPGCTPRSPAVAVDHGRALTELGVGRRAFVRDVLRLFETIVPSAVSAPAPVRPVGARAGG